MRRHFEIGELLNSTQNLYDRYGLITHGSIAKAALLGYGSLRPGDIDTIGPPELQQRAKTVGLIEDGLEVSIAASLGIEGLTYGGDCVLTMCRDGLIVEKEAPSNSIVQFGDYRGLSTPSCIWLMQGLIGPSMPPIIEGVRPKRFLTDIRFNRCFPYEDIDPRVLEIIEEFRGLYMQINPRTKFIDMGSQVRKFLPKHMAK